MTDCERIDEWAAAHRDELVKDIGRLVRIRSVAEENEGEHPYGEGCAKALDELLAMGKEYGFETENHEYRCGSILLPPPEGGKTYGLWGHLDVVPEGDGWINPPYECTEKQGFLIGRGVGDNKGPTVADLYVMRCIRDLGLPFQSGIRLIGGCCEETGMSDVTYYVENKEVPYRSLVTDCGFPVCHGEKGIIEFSLRFAGVDERLLSLSGGIASNVVPAQAEAVWADGDAQPVLPEGVTVLREGGVLRLSAQGAAAHSASPKGGVDAIGLLAQALSSLEGPSKEAFAFVARVCGCFDGKELAIDCADEVSGALTCVGSMASLEGRELRLLCNIRFPVTVEADWLRARAKEACEKNGCALVEETFSAPGYMEKADPFVQALARVYREATGKEAEPYVMSGGTYARKIPNAVGFGPGMDADMSVLGLPEGHGGCHGPDEVQSIDNLLTAMKIYVRALLALDRSGD